MPIKSRWKIACRAFGPSTILAESHFNEFTTQPGGSLMSSELPFMTAILVLIKVQNQLRADVQPENTALPRWLILHLAVGWLFTTHSMPHSCKKPPSKSTRVICFASFHWQRAERCLQGWITTARQWFYTMLHTQRTVYLKYMETPCRLGIWSGGFHFSHSLLPKIDSVGAEKANSHLLQNKVKHNLNVTHVFK